MFPSRSRLLQKSLLPSLLLSLLMLAFALIHRPLAIGSWEISTAVLFLTGYLWLTEWSALVAPSHMRRLSGIIWLVGTLAWGMAQLIAHLPYQAASSLVGLALWEYAIPSEVMGYALVIFLRSLLSWKEFKNLPLFKKRALPAPLFALLWDGCFAGSSIMVAMLIREIYPMNLQVFCTSLICSLGSLALLRTLHWMVSKSRGVKSIEKPPSQSKEPSLSWGYYLFLLLFVGTCLITNLLVVKHITWHGYTCTAGVLTYPLTFLCIDIISERYGRANAKAVIWSGLCSNLFFLAGIIGTAILPHKENLDESLFWSTFGFVSTSLIASLIAYLGAQLLSLALFHRLRLLTQGDHLWLRNNITTFIGQGVDTALFALVAWGLWYIFPASQEAPLSAVLWWQITRNEYLIKVLLALLDTPILYLTLALLGRPKASSTEEHPKEAS